MQLDLFFLYLLLIFNNFYYFSPNIYKSYLGKVLIFEKSIPNYFDAKGFTIPVFYSIFYTHSLIFYY